MEHRRLGRLGSENSVLIFGGAALAEATEEDSDTALQQALDAGVDHSTRRPTTEIQSYSTGAGCRRSGIASSSPPRQACARKTRPSARSRTPSNACAWTTSTSFNSTL